MPWIEIGCSLLACVICIPLVLGKVPRNQLYGARTTRTMTGPESNWYSVNRTVGRTMMLTCLASAIADVVVSFLPLSQQTIYASSVVFLLLAVFAPLLLHRKLLF